MRKMWRAGIHPNKVEAPVQPWELWVVHPSRRRAWLCECWRPVLPHRAIDIRPFNSPCGLFLRTGPVSYHKDPWWLQ